MENSAGTPVSVRMGPSVTPVTGPAGVGWAGPGHGVREVSTGDAWAWLCCERSTAFRWASEAAQTPKWKERYPDSLGDLNQSQWFCYQVASLRGLHVIVCPSVSLCVPACVSGRYGANCELDCSCQNNGSCDRFTGCCHCTAGHYGHSCQHSACTPTSVVVVAEYRDT